MGQIPSVPVRFSLKDNPRAPLIFSAMIFLQFDILFPSLAFPLVSGPQFKTLFSLLKQGELSHCYVWFLRKFDPIPIYLNKKKKIQNRIHIEFLIYIVFVVSKISAFPYLKFSCVFGQEESTLKEKELHCIHCILCLRASQCIALFLCKNCIMFFLISNPLWKI